MSAWAKCLVALLLIISTTACSHKPAGQRYQIQGRVVAIDSGTRLLTIAHQDIPGMMEGMTMPFLVSEQDVWIFKSIAPGDQVHATVVLTDHAELQEVTFSRASDTESKGTSALRLPQRGDEVPNFALINQNGKAIELHQFRGKPLLLTFIYTRCPFPDYCPRMSNNFSQIMQQLLKNQKAFPQTQLLSISIDAQNDTPAVLRRYGESYAGRVDPKFAHWEFATGSPEQVRQAAQFFGLTYSQKDGQIIHSLATALIGKDGKLIKIYWGNGWTPEEVTADFITAAGV